MGWCTGIHDINLVAMVQNGIIVHCPDEHMDWCTGLHETDLVANVQNGMIVNFLDGHMDWCTGLHDTDLAAMVQNGIIVHFFRHLTDTLICALANIIQICCQSTKWYNCFFYMDTWIGVLA